MLFVGCWEFVVAIEMINVFKILTVILICCCFGLSCLPYKSSSIEVEMDSNECNISDFSSESAYESTIFVFLKDFHNYFFKSTIEMPVIQVKGNSEIVDLVFNWSRLNNDLLGRKIDPLLDIDMALVSMWRLTKDELTYQINNDSLDRRHLVGALSVETNNEVLEANLLGFTFLGNPITDPDDIALRNSFFNAESDSYNPESVTHMLSVQTGVEPGKRTRMIQLFTLSANTEKTQIDLTYKSAYLTYKVDLKSGEYLNLPIGNSNIVVDWQNLNFNSMGNEFVHTRINRVVIAHYEMTLHDLEENFLKLESIHDAWYERNLDTVSASIELSELLSVNGGFFPGITSEGIWVLALFCEDCENPAPWFMTVLNPSLETGR